VIPARAALAGALVLAACGAGLLRAAPPPVDAGLSLRLDSLDGRISRVEARVGLAPAAARPSPLLARYEELRTREARIAARVDSARLWIPDAAPLAAGTITSAYAPRRYHPVVRRVLPHWGLDIAARHGAPVFATADGVVLATFRSPTYGIGVDLRHGDTFLTRYAHLSALSVRKGDRVRRGQLLGRVGATGRTTGPHLHYEAYVRRANVYHSVDPIRLLPPDGPVRL
jgi:murein DD-endopeptidase MepM/ murein hydrolase activator NlpD